MLEDIIPYPAKDIILDFGSGIKGWIRANGKYNIEVFSKSNCWLATFNRDMLSEPMQSMVEAVDARQRKEKK